ncbi:ergothioneine biosynthesis protein EgtB [Trinickia caryophylli]|uniref:Ergothioneine biosynthesis protein EgtB n=1 Tax=Trinickia caryophylli TaxID=28094 RepID=A0A1X7EB36_TRICW|nr:ergothioneine biosynthesis protein EgtB [Trinickia caryophylli]PMS12959.1 ergothioneine biosynthesis protein EgtB [Trinickia caryophylli]TRX14722.1 ergothioneine biosynthesis protein EgtB [Trinickia caryophylli]WQE14565.1 ergothioneine biosynthesis protein EgtB [Trinickia caryophylli]SMF30727.1 ergothioneine biosynthesis protein EgtB [Trinickia caryophylli]GLU32025.1 ergothioneine biosynthesis protein EgtB [Trinickia caryophylli]
MVRDVSRLQQAFSDIRQYSVELAAPLSAEDQQVQSMTDASPTKWHLAHTTWFFETVLLVPHAEGYALFHERYPYLFNSYYEALGPRHERAQRGLLTRPSLEEVHAYRRHVDEAVRALFETADEAQLAAIEPIVTLGLHHEQQHQELILTDILHAFSCNSLMPAYRPCTDARGAAGASRPMPGAGELEWLRQPGGIVGIGHGGVGFCFDNEEPRHEVLLRPYEIAHRLVTCAEYAAFIADGGYTRAELWLSDGWAMVQRECLRAPLYWRNAAGRSEQEAQPGDWLVFGLDGLRPMNPDAPVSQLSFYEAAAYAEWAGARLPTEFEWEAAFDAPGIEQMADHVWQWTRSAYDPYPGFRPRAGVAAEYNGKFMVGQLVLRGGSVATPPGHTRRSYRNFFPPAARWQFSGVRLVRDL